MRLPGIMTMCISTSTDAPHGGSVSKINLGVDLEETVSFRGSICHFADHDRVR